MALKIYFAGSIRGGRSDVALYHRIVKLLQKYGTVLTEHVGDSGIDEKGDSHLTDKEIFDRDMDWLRSADVLVAEVTQPSLGVGYEIGRAFEFKLKVLCLFRPESGRKLSALIRGAENESTYTVVDYKTEDIDRIIDNYFKKPT